MKKFVFSLLALAALALVPSCMKELVSSPDPATGGSPVEVSFQVDLNNVMTKADNTDLDNASGTWSLYIAAFSTADGALISTSKIGGTGYEPTETLSSTTSKTVTLTLSRGASYKVVFFAEKAGAYDVSFANNNVARFSYKAGLLANSGGLDAFYATVDVNASTTAYSVTLKRPFAQVNVLVPLAAVPTGQTAFSSAMKVKAPTTFDLFAGAATGAESVVEFSSSAINTVPFGKYATTHKWVGMNYVLVNSANTVEVTSFQESGMATAIVPGKVPAKMNGRTNLVGNIYDLSAEFNFNVQIGPGFDSEGEEPVIGQQTEITLADNSTYTEANPLTINASAAAAPQNVTLRVNGHSFTEVLAGAAQGAAITAVSANTAVATASVSGNDVVITPVGNGQTVVTVTTPSYTKTDYRGASFQIPVKVEGMSGGGGQGGGSDTIVFADLNLENGTQYTNPFTQGDMSVTFAGGNNDGKYYTTGSGIRTYGEGTITVASSKNIVKIEFTFDPTQQKNGDVTQTFLPDEATFESVSVGNYDLTTQIWTGSATSVVLKRKTGTGHWRLQKVKVYYEGGGDSGESGGGGQTGDTVKSLPYSQDFKASGQGDFTIDNKTLPEALTYVWSYDNRYGMKASAYNQQAYASESWLVSPVVNLASAQHPVLTFRHAVNQFSSLDKAKEEATVWVREENGTWTQLTGVSYPASMSWSFVDSGEIDLSGYKGKKIQVAFKYVSTATKAGTWEVDKFSIAEQGSSSGQGGSGDTGGGQGGDNENLGTPDATLTNAEIRAATVDAEITSDNPSYRAGTINSASGTWTGNFAKHKDGVKFLQLRNKKGAFITSPTFSSAISKVAVTLTSEEGVTLADRTLHAVPASTVVPTGDDAYTSTLWANEYGCVRTGAEKGATVVIDFPSGSSVTQFMLIVEGGATYIDHIDVYY